MCVCVCVCVQATGVGWLTDEAMSLLSLNMSTASSSALASSLKCACDELQQRCDSAGVDYCTTNATVCATSCLVSSITYPFTRIPVRSWLHPLKGHCEHKAMRDEWVVYAAGYPLLNGDVYRRGR